jgi:hypothetical protein
VACHEMAEVPNQRVSGQANPTFQGFKEYATRRDVRRGRSDRTSVIVAAPSHVYRLIAGLVTSFSRAASS